METKTVKIGVNKRTNSKGDVIAKRRVWLEGKTLERLGWVKGVTYSRKNQLLEDGFILTKDSAGDLRVAGGDNRPVLDLCGNYIAAALGTIEDGFKEVTVTITAKRITITGKAAALLLPVFVQVLERAAS